MRSRPLAMCRTFTGAYLQPLSFERLELPNQLYRRCPRVVTEAVCRTTVIAAVASLRSEPIMTTEYTVGLRRQTRSEVLTIEAEDALIAALKAKHEHPEAVITYVRKANRRGDRRHPHGGLSDKAKK
jgi:hypothetical protein